MAESDLYDRERIFVLENTIDEPLFRQQLGALDGIRSSDQGRCFGLIGELRHQKAPLVFLKAARMALRRGINARFVIPSSRTEARCMPTLYR